jgi:hypothetical protein
MAMLEEDEESIPVIQPEDDPLDKPGYPRLRDLPREPLPDACPAEAVDALGKPLASHNASQMPRWVMLLCAGVFFFLGVSSLVGSANMWSKTIADAKERKNNDAGKVITLVGGVVFLALGGACVALPYFMPVGARLWLCPGGLIWLREKKVGWCRWGQIERFYHYSATIRYANTGGVGQKAAFRFYTPEENHEIGFEAGGNSNERTFGDRMHHYATEAMLPVFARRFEQGEALDFDQIKMHDRGLTFGRFEVAWRDVADVELKEGTFYLEQRDGLPLAVPYNLVSHALVFRALSQLRLEREKDRRRERRRARDEE